MQASGPVLQEARADNHTDHTLCIKILQASWSETTKNRAEIHAETRARFSLGVERARWLVG